MRFTWACFARRRSLRRNDSPAVVAAIPERVPRHSFAARLFHWVMAHRCLRCCSRRSCPRWDQIRLGDLPLDCWAGADGVDALSHLSCVVLHGLLVDMAGQDRPAGCAEKNVAVHWQGPRHRRTDLRSIHWKTSCITFHYCCGLGGDRNGVFMMLRVQHWHLYPQPVFVWRYDMGDDVCAARAGGRGADCANHGSCLLWRAAGEAARLPSR